MIAIDLSMARIFVLFFVIPAAVAVGVYLYIATRKKPAPTFREGATTYAYGGTWGDRIQWSGDWKKMRIVGWKWHIPQNGDRFVAPFESGWREFVILNVERFCDPSDMFFASVWHVGQCDAPPQPGKAFPEWVAAPYRRVETTFPKRWD